MVNIRICYDKCSKNELKKRMKEREFSKGELTEDTKKWIISNIDLYYSLCMETIRGLQITTDVFTDIDYPPRKFQIDRHFKQFAHLYAIYDVNKSGIYYDQECDVLYAIPNEKSDENMQIGGINVTGQIHLLWRYVYLKDEILAGQDSEFNIYKSYLFEPTPTKLVYTLLAVVVQVCCLFYLHFMIK